MRPEGNSRREEGEGGEGGVERGERRGVRGEWSCSGRHADRGARVLCAQVVTAVDSFKFIISPSGT
jgi:hypothetical protein